jgi:hypothetical protein
MRSRACCCFSHRAALIRGASCREKKRGFSTPSFRHPAQGKLTQLVSVRRGLSNDSKTEDWQISFVFAQKER